jgi:RimJ/RimL family protein N-acetyltransferase
MLETPRLILRPPVEADLAPWGELLADLDAMRFLGGPQTRPIEWLRVAMLRSFKPPRSGMLSVVEKATGRWIGRIGTWHPQGWPGTEVGWTLSRAAWGRGFATEGAARAMDWAVDELGLTDILHVIKPGNEAAAAVARRLGSRKRRSEPLSGVDASPPVDLWGQTSAEWKANRLQLSR